MHFVETTDEYGLNKKTYVHLNTAHLHSSKQGLAVDTGNLMPSHTVQMRTG